MPVEDVLASDEVVATTKEIVKSVLLEKKEMFRKSEFVNEKFSADTWQLFLYGGLYAIQIYKNTRRIVSMAHIPSLRKNIWL